MSKHLASNESLKRRKTWRPLRATDFESLMYPNFYISLIFGFFPYKCESSNYVFSRKRFVWSTLSVFIFIVLLSITIYQVNFGILKYSSVPVAIHENFYLFSEGGIIVIMYILSRTRLHVLQNLSVIAQILSRKDFNDLAKLFHTKDILGFLFLAIHLPHLFRKNVYLTLRHFTVFYMMVVCHSLDMFYMNCVCILKACFRKVNESIEKLDEPSTNDEYDAETAMKSLHSRQRSILLLTKLKNLEETHLWVSDVVQLINNTFVVHNTVLAITTFTVATFNLYFFNLWLNGVYDVDVNRQFWYVQFISSAFYYVSKFLLVIWACETAKNQALEIGTTIHDVLGNSTDVLVSHELELFSLQVLHRDNMFSARVFTMNAALLTPMVGGIVMYILILYQFLLNTINCNNQN